MELSHHATGQLEAIREIEKLATAAQETINPLTANKLAKQMQEKIVNDLPVIIKQLIIDIDNLKESIK